MTDLTYASYAADPGYVAANKALIDALPLAGTRRVADLACGTGLLTRLLLGREPGLKVTGIDLDPVQVGLARRDLLAEGRTVVETAEALEAVEGGAVRLLAQSAMATPFADGSIDLVVIGNAIHMMPDRAAFLAEVARVLRPGGRLAFNSVFFNGTFAPGTEAAFTRMMTESVLALNALNAGRRARNEPPVPRVRGTQGRAFQKDWLDAEGWAAALRDAGLAVESSGLRVMGISKGAMQAIGAYGGLAEVLMSGYPVEVASACLAEGIGRAYDDLGLAEVPRNWLEMTGVKA